MWRHPADTCYIVKGKITRAKARQILLKTHRIIAALVSYALIFRVSPAYEWRVSMACTFLGQIRRRRFLLSL